MRNAWENINKYNVNTVLFTPSHRVTYLLFSEAIQYNDID